MLASLATGDPGEVGGYRLRGRLGAGGMGIVYLGFDATDRPAAVKVIRADLADGPEFRARFRREVAAASRVTSPCVARLLDADVEARTPWMATEYVEGASLADAVARRGPLAGATLETLATGVADALVAVHAAGLVHRDLKPANVLLSWDGPRVIDFGIAHGPDSTVHTSTGQLIGTVAWMAPEQLHGLRAGPAADVFAWAMCVAFAARGHHPFAAPTTAAAAIRILNEPPDLTGVPTALASLLGRALAKEPAARPSAVALRSELVSREMTDNRDADAATRGLLAGWVVPITPPPDIGSAHPGPASPAASASPAAAASPAALASSSGPASAGVLTSAGPTSAGAGSAGQGPAGPGSAGPGSAGVPASGSGPAGVARTTPDQPALDRRRRRTAVIAAVLLLTVGALTGVVLHREGGDDGPDRAAPAPAPTDAPAPAPTAGTGAGSTVAPNGLPDGASPAAGPAAGPTDLPAPTPVGDAGPAPAPTGGAAPSTAGPAQAPGPLPAATIAGRALGRGTPTTVLSGGRGGVPAYPGPTTIAVFGRRAGTVADGGAVTMYCGVYGQAITARGSTSRLWVYTNAGWINDVYTHTGTMEPVVPACAGTLSAPTLGSGKPSSAKGPYAVVASGRMLPVRSTAAVDGGATAMLRTGDLVVLRCHVQAASVGPPPGLSATSDNWDRLASGPAAGGYVPDSHVYTGTTTSTAPAC